MVARIFHFLACGEASATSTQTYRHLLGSGCCCSRLMTGGGACRSTANRWAMGGLVKQGSPSVAGRRRRAAQTRRFFSKPSVEPDPGLGAAPRAKSGPMARLGGHAEPQPRRSSISRRGTYLRGSPPIFFSLRALIGFAWLERGGRLDARAGDGSRAHAPAADPGSPTAKKSAVPCQAPGDDLVAGQGRSAHTMSRRPETWARAAVRSSAQRPLIAGWLAPRREFKMVKPNDAGVFVFFATTGFWVFVSRPTRQTVRGRVVIRDCGAHPGDSAWRGVHR